MSLIEKAARRLEELRRAGVGTPGHTVENAGVKPEFDRSSLESLKAALMAESNTPPHDLEIPTPAPISMPRSPTVDLDLSKLALSGFITPDVQRSRLAEEFRVLKRPLIVNASGKSAVRIVNGNLIMVTSAVPGEGKSFTAINLAMSIAMELDRTVLLVDADVARPSLPRLLGLSPNLGILDVLQDQSLNLSDAILRTNIDKLSVMTSGTPHPRATELLASSEMTNLLHEMAQRYSDRIIIFDSPPLLVTSEARALASSMGQILFVVRAETTLQSEVVRALATIDTCPVKLMLLNQARHSDAGSNYGYGYGYGYS